MSQLKFTGAHQCSICGKYVHAICSAAQEEGYGKSCICSICNSEINTSAIHKNQSRSSEEKACGKILKFFLKFI